MGTMSVQVSFDRDASSGRYRGHRERRSKECEGGQRRVWVDTEVAGGEGPHPAERAAGRKHSARRKPRGGGADNKGGPVPPGRQLAPPGLGPPPGFDSGGPSPAARVDAPPPPQSTPETFHEVRMPGAGVKTTLAQPKEIKRTDHRRAESGKGEKKGSRRVWVDEATQPITLDPSPPSTPPRTNPPTPPQSSPAKSTKSSKSAGKSPISSPAKPTAGLFDSRQKVRSLEH